MTSCSDFLERSEQHFKEQVNRYINAVNAELKEAITWPFQYYLADINISKRDRLRFKQAVRRHFEQKDKNGKAFNVFLDCNLNAEELGIHLQHPDECENTDAKCKECEKEIK